MKKYIFVFFVLIGLSTLVAQEKYLIFFKDKGSLSKRVLTQSSLEILAKTTLSNKSIERRKKVLGENYFTEEDFPIDKDYLLELNKLNIKIVNKLKWFNAVSAFLDDEQIKSLNKMKFVKEIKRVKAIRYKNYIKEK